MKNFYQDKTVLVTGHTGFKGSWLCIWLLSMGAKVIGYGLDPYTEQDNFVRSGLHDKLIDIRGDIGDEKHMMEVFTKYGPDMVFHLAAQPIVRLSYDIPVETYEVNVMGTIHVLECIRKCQSVKAAVLITTDKCYENKETLTGYVETDAFGGYDPYSSSKACDEIVISSWRRSFFGSKMIASVRAGNVIGGGDWQKDRLLPDCIRYLEKGEPIVIRNRHAVRPWQHVLEPLSGYLMLGMKLWQNPVKYATGFNFGPDETAVRTVWDVAGQVISCYEKGERVDQTQPGAVHEAGKLTLNAAKAKKELGWEPKLSVEDAVGWTVEWYANREVRDAYDICMEQIKRYEKR